MQNMKNQLARLIVLFLMLSLNASGQIEHNDHAEKPGGHENHSIQHHKLVLFTGYALIPGAVDLEGNETEKIIPLLGVDYEYRFNHKWAILFLNDLELATYSVELDHQAILERNYAFVTALTASYEILDGWAVFAGPGYEIEKNNNFSLFKLGTEIFKTFDHGWNAGIAVVYDFKEVNSSLNFGLAVGKRFVKFK